MDHIDTLIRDLEGASEGSRELDGEIALLLGWVKHHAGWAHWTTPEGLENQHVPFFSDSLDDALTLVPEGWGWLVEVWQREESWAQVVRRPEGSTKPSGVFEGAEAKSPALALCIAAIKARRAA